jgi:cyclopropane fatty-acyl-phospholipid synthase-like methyltransferase
MMTTKPSNWNNHDNAKFYNTLLVEDFKKLAKLAGLESCPDVELILPHLKPDSVILEVGAGYGRVLNCLINKGFKNLYAIERDPNLCKLLQQQFGNKVNLIQQDLHDFKTGVKFDAILWLWAGISDFAKDEQFGMLQKLASFLKTNSIFFLDTMIAPIKLAIDCLCIKKNESILTYKNNFLHGYFPSITQLKLYSKKLNLLHSRINYTPPNGPDRILHSNIKP